jgi:DNA polymerase-3 subunit chi
MPTQVDFYTTADARPEAAARLLCRVIEKAYKQGRTLFVHTASPRRARFIDDLLWTFRDGSFVPHECMDGAQTPSTPVRIGSGNIVRGDATVLVNLSEQVPLPMAGFERVVDAAPGGDPGLSAGRQRYRWYQQQPVELQHHQL